MRSVCCLSICLTLYMPLNWTRTPNGSVLRRLWRRSAIFPSCAASHPSKRCWSSRPSAPIDYNLLLSSSCAIFFASSRFLHHPCLWRVCWRSRLTQHLYCLFRALVQTCPRSCRSMPLRPLVPRSMKSWPWVVANRTWRCICCAQLPSLVPGFA